MNRRTLLSLATAGAAGLVFAGCHGKAATPRRLAQVLPGTRTKDGAGVKLTRLLGSQALRMLDPFLLLDCFGSDDPADYLKGFPKHPHRGFETVTILLDGTVEHRDSVGNHGTLLPGGIQWMTAGRGIVHEEMPKPLEGRNRGLQLWVNLPAAHKWDPPRYQDVKPADVPEIDHGGARVRVLAGRLDRVEGPVSGVVVRPVVYDVRLPAGGTFETDVPGTHTVFLAGIDGELQVGPDRRPLPPAALGVTTAGDRLTVRGSGRFLLAAGAPIGEPVARGGPFVMNTEAEIEQAWADYRSGRLTDG